MSYQTIVAVYDTLSNADAAVRDLRSANVPVDAISQQRGDAGTGHAAAPVREQGFWASLLGGEPDHDTAVYDRSMDSGSSVVTVRVPAEDFDRVSTILEVHQPIDLDERAAQYRCDEHHHHRDGHAGEGHRIVGHLDRCDGAAGGGNPRRRQARRERRYHAHPALCRRDPGAGAGHAAQ